MPISAFIFGGRLSRTFPLVFEAFNWQHGVYLAATMGSEATAAADNQAAIRRDPFAMLPFCGYNMADYWNHWLSMEKRVRNLPRIFRVNWFRQATRTANSPGPASARTCACCNGSSIACAAARRAPAAGPFGYMPHYQDLNWQDLAFSPERFSKIMAIDRAEARAEARDQEELFDRFGSRLPAELEEQRQQLMRRLEAPSVAATP